MGKGKLAWVAILPATWVLVSTLYAGTLKLLPVNGERVHDSVSHIALWQINSSKADELLAKIVNTSDESFSTH